MAQIYSEVALSAEELQAIGAVVVECTFLEHTVEYYIWQICHLTNEQGKLFTFGFQLESKLDILQKLAKIQLTDKKVLAEFVELISEIKKQTAHRNTIIHGRWVAPRMMMNRNGKWSRSGEAYARTRSRKSDQITTFKAKEVKAIAEQIFNLHQKLILFVAKHLLLPFLPHAKP